jgi:hypothetical protein
MKNENILEHDTGAWGLIDENQGPKISSHRPFLNEVTSTLHFSYIFEFLLLYIDFGARVRISFKLFVNLKIQISAHSIHCVKATN